MLNALTEGNVYIQLFNVNSGAPVAHFGPYVGMIAANEAVHQIDAEMVCFPEFDTRLLGEGTVIAQLRRNGRPRPCHCHKT